MTTVNTNAIKYSLVQHETTGELWAIKFRMTDKKVLGARRFDMKDQPYVEDLPNLTYDVGTAREYAQEMSFKFAIWPFQKNRPTEPSPTADK